jgi:hypothetical protein
MTKGELNQLWHINREIEEIKSEIENISYLEAVKPKEAVQTSSISDSTGERACILAELKELYDIKLKEMFIKKAKIERFLDGIEDNEMRLIFRLRHVNCLEWNEIAAELNYHRVTVCKKYYKLLNSLHTTT